jgi:hypothetical protein
MAAAPFRDGDRFFFARSDMTAQAADLPPGNKARALTIQGAAHSTLAAREEVWNEVFAQMR